MPKGLDQNNCNDKRLKVHSKTTMMSANAPLQFALRFRTTPQNAPTCTWSGRVDHSFSMCLFCEHVFAREVLPELKSQSPIPEYFICRCLNELTRRDGGLPTVGQRQIVIVGFINCLQWAIAFTLRRRVQGSVDNVTRQLFYEFWPLRMLNHRPRRSRAALLMSTRCRQLWTHAQLSAPARRPYGVNLRMQPAHSS